MFSSLARLICTRCGALSERDLRIDICNACAGTLFARNHERCLERRGRRSSAHDLALARDDARPARLRLGAPRAKACGDDRILRSVRASGGIAIPVTDG